MYGPALYKEDGEDRSTRLTIVFLVMYSTFACRSLVFGNMPSRHLASHCIVRYGLGGGTRIPACSAIPCSLGVSLSRCCTKAALAMHAVWELDGVGFKS